MLKQAHARKISDQVPCGICSFCSSFSIYHMHIYMSLTQYFCVAPHTIFLRCSPLSGVTVSTDSHWTLCALRNTSVLPNCMTQLSSLHIWSINIERTKVDKWKAFAKQGIFPPRKLQFQVLITIYRKFIVCIDYGKIENLQWICIVLPAPHVYDFHVSKILQLSCRRSSATPISECLCPVLQLSRLEGRTAAPRSQITAQEQAACSLQPWAFPTCPFLSPSPTLQSDSQSSFEAFSTKLFPVLWLLSSRENFFMKRKGYTTLIWWWELQPEYWRHTFSYLLCLI